MNRPFEAGTVREPMIRRSSVIRAPLLALLVALSGLAGLRVAEADTTVYVRDIGTTVTGTAFPIQTHAEKVTYSGPVDVVIHGMQAVEIRGTVSGTGWGGTGIVDRAANAHYHYDIPFVARWRKNQASSRLVFYYHGGGPGVRAVVKRDKLSAATNVHRFAELNGDALVGVPALLNDATYISINRRGMRGDGTFSATYLSEVPPLTAAEVATITEELASAPGPVGFMQPGIAPGAPVPTHPTFDAPTCRDVARALERVVAKIQNTEFRTRIATGVSSGARLCGALSFGRTIIGSLSVRTGGNYVIPYDPNSTRIFDGFILNGFPYGPGDEHADAAVPWSAPTMFIQGQGDVHYQEHVTMAYELLQKRVDLRDRVWIYEIKNLIHGTRDTIYDTTTPWEGDRLGCFVSAAIGNLREFIEDGRRPPLSRIAGRIVAGELRFDQAGGTTTDKVPVPNDPALDSVVADVNLTPWTIGSGETARWREVTYALPHEDAITGPTVSCRLGGYKLMTFGYQLLPFPSSELTARYRTFERYRDCVHHAVESQDGLAKQRLYDPQVETASETAERARILFDSAAAPHATSEPDRDTEVLTSG